MSSFFLPCCAAERLGKVRRAQRAQSSNQSASFSAMGSGLHSAVTNASAINAKRAGEMKEYDITILYYFGFCSCSSSCRCNLASDWRRILQAYPQRFGGLLIMITLQRPECCLCLYVFGTAVGEFNEPSQAANNGLAALVGLRCTW